MTARRFSAALTGIVLAALAAAAAHAATAPQRATRAPATLASLARTTLPTNAIVSTSDTFLVRSHGFDDLAGACQDRGWVGQDRTSQVYTHVVSDKTVNQQYFTGLSAAGVIGQNLTGRLQTTRLYGGVGLGVTDSGVVLIADDSTVPRLFAAYPGTGVLRVFSAWTGTPQKFVGVAYDRVASRTIVSCGDVGLYWCAGNGEPPQLIGGLGSVTGDTTILVARVEPRGLAVDKNGNIYFSEYNTNRVRMLRTDGRVVTVAGTGFPGFAGDGGPATAAALFKPDGVTLDDLGGSLYVSDQGNRRVRRIDLSSGIIETTCGDGTFETLGAPFGITWSGGGLFITTGSGRVFRFAAGTLTPVAGASSTFGPAAGLGSAMQQVFGQLQDVAPDGSGGVYFMDLGLTLVFHLDAGGALSVLAGVPVPIAMGNRSLWFGADMASYPDEVANWARPSGYGNGWGQSLDSPTFSFATHPGAVLRFDGRIRLRSDVPLTEVGVDPFVLVMALNTSGTWSPLRARFVPVGGVEAQYLQVAGFGLFKAEVHLNADGNEFNAIAPDARLRILLQTGTVGSNEDGLGVDQPDGALVVDNMTIRDGDLDLVAPADFEDGTFDGWTASAINGAYRPGDFVSSWTRDVQPDPTLIELRKGFDFSDPGCVWTFAAVGDSLNHRGLYARVTSPWVALGAPADSAHPVLITFSGKLPTLNTGRTLDVWVRGKLAGDTRPRFATPTYFAYNSGTYGGDDASPYLDQAVLRYPLDFQHAEPMDSIQVMFVAQDQSEVPDLMLYPPGYQFMLDRSKLPYLDDLRVYQLGVDRDHDGVADAVDACPDSCAAGQDADDDGCVDPTSTMRHVESWDRKSLPLHYSISTLGDPRITDGSDFTAIHDGFAAWTLAPGTGLQVVQDLPSARTNASSYDGANLVTFQDDYSFPPNVVALTPTLSALRRTAYDDQIVLPGQIVDSDMMFNPQMPFRTPSYDPGGGALDLKSVVTHEAGHFFGLSHSGVLNSTMFFVLQAGQGAASLEADDQAAIAAAYPGPTFAADFAAITGQVVRGGSLGSIPGALVTAVRLDPSGQPADSVASDYTDEGGNYALRALAPGSYSVRVTPLDGEVGGYALTPQYISDRLAAVAQTNFSAEWWCEPESDRDTPDQRGTLALAAGETRAGINVITNVDTIPPSVLAVSPGGDTTNIRIDTSILVKFSERIDDTTLQGSFRLHVEGQVNALGGSGTLVNNGRNLVFNPTNPLLFGTRYVLDITTGLMDREGVPMAAPFSTAFTTQAAPPVAIADIQPRAAAPGSFITILGTGYDPMGTDSVQFAVGVVPVVVRWPAVSVTPTSMLVRVPPSAVSGPVRVFVNGDTSNVFDFTVLPAAVTSAPSFVTDVTLSFSPTDVALAPAGATAYAVGSGGLAVVDLQSGQVQVEAIGAARSLALTPDGRRAVVTRTTSADVVVVDVAYGSGTFGQVLGTTPLPDGARPAGVAIAPTGRVAWVTDPALRMVHQIDIDPLSVTCYSVMGEAADSVVSMGDGIAVSPAGGAVYYASSNAGARVVRLPGGSPGGASSIVSSGGVAADPAADEVLFADAGLLGSSVLAITVSGDSAFASTTRFMGGEVRDVAYGRDGNTAYLVNAATNQLQMISTDPDGGNYLSKLAEVGTGASPVAVAVSGFGDVIATADYGSRTISVFRTGGTSGLVRAVRAVASPGDVVALQGSGAPFGAGSQVDVGTGPFAPSFRAPGALGAAFVVPPGAQRDGSVAAVDSTGMRTLGLALRVVDPIDTPTPRRTGFELHQDSLMCLLGFTYGLIEHVRTSPDGGMVAVARALTTPTSCGSTLELFDMRDFAVMRLGSLSATMPGLAPASDQVLDMEYTTDGRQLWAATSDLSVKIVDTDPSSPSYATVVNTLGLTVAGSPGSVAADPLGRFMAVGDYAADSVRFFGTAGANRVGAVGMPAVTWALAFSPDGRYLVAAGGGQVSVLDINTFTPLAPSPVHGAGAAVPYDVAVARDGRNAMVLFPGGAVGVYNLDAGSGPVGGERYFGVLATGSLSPAELVPAPDGHGFLAATAGGDSILFLDPRPATPAVRYLPLGQLGMRLASSPDGRLLWVGEYRTNGTQASVRLFSLSEAAAVAVVAGNAQSGLEGTVLAQPVRFRVTDGLGRPQAGAVLRFDGVHGAMPILDNWDTPMWHYTDANGEVSVHWRTSTSLGTDSLVVGILGVPGVSAIATAHVVQADSVLPPAVLSLGPVNGATGLNAGTAVSATFNKAVDSASVVARMKLYTGPNPVNGAYHASADRKTFFFQPGQALSYSARCSLVVDAGIVDTYSLTTSAGMTSVFTVQAAPALSIVSLTPPAGPTATPVVIGGQGFSPVAAQNTVLFNGVLATVTSATATSLVANVPLAATSGPVTVQVGNGTSNGIGFVVLDPNASPGGVINNLPAGQGVRDVAITSDGLRAYVTNPASNSVTALDIQAAQTITSVTVGLQPQGVALLPDDSRAYVANTGSNDVSVIDIRPASPGYHTVVATIPVGTAPIDIAVSALGPKVVVVNEGSSNASIIDANPGNATYDQVLTTVNTGSGGKGVAISPDGTTAYVATAGGTVVVIDVNSGAVLTTVNTGSGGKGITITPDGTVVLVLCENGTIAIIDVAPGSPSQYQVLTTVNTGSGGKGITVSPDGALVYVTSADGNSVLVFSITSSNVPSASVISPSASVVLTLVATIVVGESPDGIAIDPSHGAFALVCNSGSGTVSVIGMPSSLPPVTAEFDFDPNTFNLNSIGKWVTGYIEPPPPLLAADIVLSSIRLNGLVAADTSAGTALGDHDGDGVPDLMVKFPRTAVSLLLPDGDAVVVTVTGTVGPRLFTGTDTVRVKRAKLTAPAAHAVLAPGHPYTVRWEVPTGFDGAWVAVLHTFDEGGTWVVDGTHLPNTGSFEWQVPNAGADSARIGVVLVESADSTGSNVDGVLSVSGVFRVLGVTEVEPLPVVLSFAPVRPNPAAGEALLRFGLPRAADVRLEVFDLQGRRVRTLASGAHAPGWHEVHWTGRTDEGARLNAGLYFVRFKAEGRELKQRLVWLK